LKHASANVEKGVVDSRDGGWAITGIEGGGGREEEEEDEEDEEDEEEGSIDIRISASIAVIFGSFNAADSFDGVIVQCDHD